MRGARLECDPRRHGHLVVLVGEIPGYRTPNPTAARGADLRRTAADARPRPRLPPHRAVPWRGGAASLAAWENSAPARHGPHSRSRLVRAGVVDDVDGVHPRRDPAESPSRWSRCPVGRDVHRYRGPSAPSIGPPPGIRRTGRGGPSRLEGHQRASSGEAGLAPASSAEPPPDPIISRTFSNRSGRRKGFNRTLSTGSRR